MIITLEKKVVILDSDNQQLTSLLEDSISRYKVSDKGESEIVDNDAHNRKGILPVLLQLWEKTTQTAVGGKIFILPAIHNLKLAEAPYELYKDYCSFLLELLKSEDKFLSIAEADIKNKFVFLYHILTRIVALALSQDNFGARDGDVLLAVMENFISELNKLSESTLQRPWFKWDKTSNFSRSFITSHPNWIGLFKNVVLIVKSLSANELAIETSSSALEKAIVSIQQRLLFAFIRHNNSSIESNDMLDVGLPTALYREQLIYLNKSGLVKSNPNTLFLGGLKKKNALENIQSEVVKKIAQKHSTSQVLANVQSLYKVLNHALLLKRVVGRVGDIMGTTAWVAIISGVINIRAVINALRVFSEECIPVMRLSDTVHQKEIDFLVKAKNWQGGTVLDDLEAAAVALNKLHHPSTLKILSTFIKSSFSDLRDLQVALKSEALLTSDQYLVSEEALQYLMKGVSEAAAASGSTFLSQDTSEVEKQSLGARLRNGIFSSARTSSSASSSTRAIASSSSSDVSIALETKGVDVFSEFNLKKKSFITEIKKNIKAQNEKGERYATILAPEIFYYLFGDKPRSDLDKKILPEYAELQKEYKKIKLTEQGILRNLIQAGWMYDQNNSNIINLANIYLLAQYLDFHSEIEKFFEARAGFLYLALALCKRKEVVEYFLSVMESKIYRPVYISMETSFLHVLAEETCRGLCLFNDAGKLKHRYEVISPTHNAVQMSIEKEFSNQVSVFSSLEGICNGKPAVCETSFTVETLLRECDEIDKLHAENNFQGALQKTTILLAEYPDNAVLLTKEALALLGLLHEDSARMNCKNMIFLLIDNNITCFSDTIILLKDFRGFLTFIKNHPDIDSDRLVI